MNVDKAWLAEYEKKKSIMCPENSLEKYFTEKGRKEGEAKVHIDTALEMLKDGEKLPKIIKYSKLTEADILSLAKQNGLEVVVA